MYKNTQNIGRKTEVDSVKLKAILERQPDAYLRRYFNTLQPLFIKS